MPTSGPNSGGTFTDLGDNDVAWTSPSNVAASDNSYATVTVSAVAVVSNSLDVTNLGFSIPGGSTINGVLVEIEIKASVTGAAWNQIQVLPSGSSLFGDAISTTEAYVSYGGPTSLWGGLSVATVNSSSFGVRLSVYRSSGGPQTVSMDHVRITVYYTPGASFPPRVKMQQAVKRASFY